MNKKLEEKWYNSFTKEQLIERCKYLQRSCDRKESSNFELEQEIERLNDNLKQGIEYSKELMLFKKNSRQYLIGKCMLEKLGGKE